MSYNRTTVKTVNLRLKAALVESGLFQYEAAKKLSIPLTTFNMKLLGRRKWSEDEMDRIAKVVHKPVEYLFPASQNTESVSDTQAKAANE